jgi:hypothetical protein
MKKPEVCAAMRSGPTSRRWVTALAGVALMTSSAINATPARAAVPACPTAEQVSAVVGEAARGEPGSCTYRFESGFDDMEIEFIETSDVAAEMAKQRALAQARIAPPVAVKAGRYKGWRYVVAGDLSVVDYDQKGTVVRTTLYPAELDSAQLGAKLASLLAAVSLPRALTSCNAITPLVQKVFPDASAGEFGDSQCTFERPDDRSVTIATLPKEDWADAIRTMKTINARRKITDVTIKGRRAFGYATFGTTVMLPLDGAVAIITKDSTNGPLDPWPIKVAELLA